MPVVCIYSIHCIYTRYLVKPPVDRAADEIRMENSISLGDRYHKLEGTFPRKEEILPINREWRVSTTDKISETFWVALLSKQPVFSSIRFAAMLVHCTAVWKIRSFFLDVCAMIIEIFHAMEF